MSVKEILNPSTNKISELALPQNLSLPPFVVGYSYNDETITSNKTGTAPDTYIDQFTFISAPIAWSCAPNQYGQFYLGGINGLFDYSGVDAPTAENSGDSVRLVTVVCTIASTNESNTFEMSLEAGSTASTNGNRCLFSCFDSWFGNGTGSFAVGELVTFTVDVSIFRNTDDILFSSAPDNNAFFTIIVMPSNSFNLAVAP